jgi:hypothetical protein
MRRIRVRRIRHNLFREMGHAGDSAFPARACFFNRLNDLVEVVHHPHGWPGPCLRAGGAAA